MIIISGKGGGEMLLPLPFYPLLFRLLQLQWLRARREGFKERSRIEETLRVTATSSSISSSSCFLTFPLLIVIRLDERGSRYFSFLQDVSCIFVSWCFFSLAIIRNRCVERRVDNDNWTCLSSSCHLPFGDGRQASHLDFIFPSTIIIHIEEHFRHDVHLALLQFNVAWRAKNLHLVYYVNRSLI